MRVQRTSNSRLSGCSLGRGAGSQRLPAAVNGELDNCLHAQNEPAGLCKGRWMEEEKEQYTVRQSENNKM